MGGRGERLAQCSKVRVVTNKAIPMQVDGEPCLLAPSQILLTFHSKVLKISILLPICLKTSSKSNVLSLRKTPTFSLELFISFQSNRPCNIYVFCSFQVPMLKRDKKIPCTPNPLKRSNNNDGKDMPVSTDFKNKICIVGWRESRYACSNN